MKTSASSVLRPFAFALAAALLALAPGRAAADPAAIFVSDYNFPTGNVHGYSVTGAAPTGFTAPAGLREPQGIVYNPANNTLYVAARIDNNIRTFNATTGAETTASTGFANATGLNGPVGLTLNAGVLYAANSNANTITAYNAATGQSVTGFNSPTGLAFPYGLASNSTTLFVANDSSNTMGAYNLATGLLTFSITGLNDPAGMALYGNDLFVTNHSPGIVGEYNALTGAVINANFITGLNGPHGLAILGNRLLVSNDAGGTVGAYGIPDVTTLNNVPTSSNASFLTGLNEPNFIAVVVPEPGTWALLAVGTVALALAARRRRVRAA